MQGSRLLIIVHISARRLGGIVLHIRQEASEDIVNYRRISECIPARAGE